MKVLIAEISGKRPGDSKKRPTEKMPTKHDKVIISNNSDGYITTWPLVNVPDDYREWYIQNHKNSENAWYAPMNRSYAIKYARERGYDYLVQLDDNICTLEIDTFIERNGRNERRRIRNNAMLDEYIEMFTTVLENTNAVMAGGQLNGIGIKDGARFMIEGYVYSIFCLKLSKCPDVFHGDFEDDIEYRLKCRQMGLPVVQITPLRYSKVGQQKTKDLSGCRAEYLKQGLKRGEHMSKLYPDTYSCHMTNKAHYAKAKKEKENTQFQHQLTPFKLGVIVYNMQSIKDCFRKIVLKNTTKKPDKVVIKEKRIKKRG